MLIVSKHASDMLSFDVQAKLDQVADLGCSSFAILFDDIEGNMTQEDLDTFESLSHAHCVVSNKVGHMLQFGS
jgi:protein O-GlcNAcase/histone acetyltransferase